MHTRSGRVCEPPLSVRNPLASAIYTNRPALHLLGVVRGLHLYHPDTNPSGGLRPCIRVPDAYVNLRCRFAILLLRRFTQIGPRCGPICVNGRGERIRTSDPRNPIAVRYQAALRPEKSKRKAQNL